MHLFMGDFFPNVMTSKTSQVSGSFPSNQIPVQLTIATDATQLVIELEACVVHWSVLCAFPLATGNPYSSIHWLPEPGKGAALD